MYCCFGLALLPVGHGVRVGPSVCLRTGLLESVAEAADPPHPLGLLGAHRLHAAVVGPPHVVAQVVHLALGLVLLLGGVGVVSLEDAPRLLAALDAVGVGAPVVEGARLLAHADVLVLARLLRGGEVPEVGLAGEAHCVA
eukprot:6527530-Prymnesium_polylepis.1